MSADKLDNGLVVEVASGKFVPVSDYIKNIAIDLHGNKLHEELFPIELNGFNIVLGMDWLSENENDVKCRKKIVVIKPPGREPSMAY